jgi:endonuclease III
VPSDVQAMENARATGSSVVNTRYTAKTISIGGYLSVDANIGPTDLQDLITQYDKIFEIDMALLMKGSGIGCYNLKSRTFRELAHADLDLKTCTTDDLEKIPGIGMKTSRCFIIHSRQGARYAGLDTHILKFLRSAGVENVPKATPSSKKEYLRLEKEFLRLADLAGKAPAVFDLEIWNKYSIKIKEAA